MFRITFRLSLPDVEGTIQLGNMITDQDDPYRALDVGREKRAGLASALRETMPMCKKIKAEDIEVAITVHSPQLVLFEMPDMKREEVVPGKKAYEM